MEKLLYSARLCMMVFSTGEPIPYQHYGKFACTDAKMFRKTVYFE